MNRHWKRWLVAAAGSIVICGLFFVYLNRNGCWLYWRGSNGVVVFVIPAFWLILLFGFHWKARITLLGLTAVGIFLLLPTDIVWVKFAAAESRAVTTLRRLRSDLEIAKDRKPAEGYPENLQTANVGPKFPDSFHAAYRYDYVVSRSPDGTIPEYLIRATPTRRDCGCCLRSFTILSDGRIYWTQEQRPATILDSLLQ